MARKGLQLRIRGNATKDLQALATSIHKRVQSSGFNKTDFALALLAEDPTTWAVPTYIAEGLKWLEDEIAPPAEPEDDDEQQHEPDEAVAAEGMAGAAA